MIFVEHFSHGIGLVRATYTNHCKDKVHVVEFVREAGAETCIVLACECEEATESDWADARANPPKPVIF
tara:strand:- start:70 stop:276 length:207 start_codon:yes stop_codon:yes gene_type:complete